jgi:hypothetical protein
MLRWRNVVYRRRIRRRELWPFFTAVDGYTADLHPRQYPGGIFKRKIREERVQEDLHIEI